MPLELSDDDSLAAGKKAERPKLTAANRVAALVFGVAYLLTLGVAFSFLAEVPLALALALVFAGAAVIMASLAVFRAKHARESGKIRRIGLSNILLIFVPISVYLAALHWWFRGLRNEWGPDGPIPWPVTIYASVLAIFAVAFTTFVLFRLADAIAWIVARATIAIRRIVDGRRKAK